MDEVTPLDRLIEAVEAGNFWDDVGIAIAACEHAGIPAKDAQSVRTAYHGSLDAAQALHEALLPGVMARITDHGLGYEDIGRWHVAVNWPHIEWQPQFTGVGPFRFSGQSNNPARAWLIATLKAYRDTKGGDA